MRANLAWYNPLPHLKNSPLLDAERKNESTQAFVNFGFNLEIN